MVRKQEKTILHICRTQKRGTRKKKKITEIKTKVEK